MGRHDRQPLESDGFLSGDHGPNTPPHGSPQQLMSFIDALNRLLDLLAERNQRMSALDDILTDIAASLGAVSEQLAKGFEEITAKIEELSNTAESGETVDPATLDALHAQVTALASQAQAIDDVVPDTMSQDDTSGEAPAS